MDDFFKKEQYRADGLKFGRIPTLLITIIKDCKSKSYFSTLMKIYPPVPPLPPIPPLPPLPPLDPFEASVFVER